MSGFDLALAFPQWQGSGRYADLPRGAEACAQACGRFAPLVRVPLDDAEGAAHGVRRWDAIFAQYLSARALLAEHAPRRLLTAGGDCAVDVAAIGHLHALYPDLTVVWVDAHLDANTPETSPSGSFHGMVVSAVLGHAPAPMRALLGAPVSADRFLYFGTRLGDEGELAFQRAHGLAMLSAETRLAGPVHIHFDLDALDPAEFPHIAYPEGAVPVDKAIALIERIAREADLVGLSITEFAPADEAAALDGSNIIARLCAAAMQ